MDGAGRLRRDVAPDVPWERELLEELLHPFRILALVRIDLRVRPFEIRRPQDPRCTVARSGHEDHVEILLEDQPIQVHPDEGQCGARAPVAEEPVLDVLRLQRLPEQRVVLEEDHPYGQVVARPPVRVHQLPLFVGEQLCFGHCLLVENGRFHDFPSFGFVRGGSQSAASHAALSPSMLSLYLPNAAALLHRQRRWKARWAAARFSSLPEPGPERLVLQRAPVRETELPGFRPLKPVDRVQMRAGGDVALAAGQEDDSGNRRRHVAGEAPKRGDRDLLDGGLPGARHARDDHVGFQEHGLERHLLIKQRLKDRAQHFARHFLAALDRVGSRHEHFGFDDGHYFLFLAERGVSREGMGIGMDTGPTRQRVGDGDDGPPLGEARAEVAVLLESGAEPVEPLGDPFVRRARERFGAIIDLDAREDALLRQEIGQWRSRRARLVDRLVLQDHAADELGDPGRREKHLAVIATAVGCRLDSDRSKAARYGRNRLVGREDAFPSGDELSRGFGQVDGRHMTSWPWVKDSILFFFSRDSSFGSMAFQRWTAGMPR